MSKYSDARARAHRLELLEAELNRRNALASDYLQEADVAVRHGNLKGALYCHEQAAKALRPGLALRFGMWLDG